LIPDGRAVVNVHLSVTLFQTNEPVYDRYIPIGQPWFAAANSESPHKNEMVGALMEIFAVDIAPLESVLVS